MIQSKGVNHSLRDYGKLLGCCEILYNSNYTLHVRHRDTFRWQMAMNTLFDVSVSEGLLANMTVCGIVKSSLFIRSEWVYRYNISQIRIHHFSNFK